MKNNLELYDKVKVVPETAKKSIGGGKLKGMSDINPMWRIKTLTEQFGMCGVGWYTTIDKQWLEPNLATGEVAAFINISLYVKLDPDIDIWSKPIFGNGGNSFISSVKKKIYEKNVVVGEKDVLETNDECFKMAYTDALSVACKALGVGADVYFANDQTKYDALKPEEVVDKRIKWSETLTPKVIEWMNANVNNTIDVACTYYIMSPSEILKLNKAYTDKYLNNDTSV